ncbi:MAG: flagellar basal body L-ring protein FlgH [Nibricoccus sp.]
MKFSLTLLCALTPALALADSLWTSPASNERSMYADRKATRVGDIVTVVVSETAATQSSQSKKTNKDGSLNASVSSFLFPSSRLGTHNGELPATSMTGSSSFSGGGQVANSQSLSARAAVLVSEVLPNGNLVIEGVRVVTFSGETQYIVLHGVIRPDDITSANTILSTNIADVRIEFISEGSLTDAQKKSWLLKVVDKVRPF